jgi:cold shock CspA family protein
VRVTGKIVRFDDIRGYGFIAPDSGGDDVFLHANDLEIEKSAARPGTKVSFETEDGPRGKFATTVRLSDHAHEQTEARVKDTELVSDEYLDVLSREEFQHTITDILLDVTPTLTGEQIKQVRMVFETLARKHGWIET